MSKKDDEIFKETLEYHKKLNLLVAIRNTISLICFIVLAIVFKKWWIVLFSLLFLSYVGKEENKEDE